MKNVYVVTESGVWDYENGDDTIETFDSFEKALKRYVELREVAIEDMKNWLDEEDKVIDESIDKEKESATFEIYENGYYARLHDTIMIRKSGVQ